MTMKAALHDRLLPGAVCSPPTCSRVPNLTHLKHTHLCLKPVTRSSLSPASLRPLAPPTPAPSTRPSLTRPAAVGVGYRSNSLFL